MAHNTSTTGEHAGSAGQQLGDAVKGAWNVFHGAGEAIRGNINQAADAAGESIQRDGGRLDPARADTGAAGATSGVATGTTTGTGATERTFGSSESGGQTAQRGVSEFEQGMDKLRR